MPNQTTDSPSADADELHANRASQETEVISLTINGEAAETTAPTLAALLAERDFTGLKVATALNGDFVPASRREQTALRAGDRVEVLSARQGG